MRPTRRRPLRSSLRASALAIVVAPPGFVPDARTGPPDLSQTPQVQVTIVITSKGHVKKRVVVGAMTTGTHTFRWKCTLAAGRYRWKVNAIDQSGNAQVSARANNLIVG